MAIERALITVEALAAILAHARAEAPRECCGLLAGPGSGDAGDTSSLTITRAIPTRNAAPEATRYLIDPSDHFRALRETRQAGLTVLGAYHSHPASAPVPSPTDLAEALPAFLYLIASLFPSSPPGPGQGGAHDEHISDGDGGIRDVPGRGLRAWWLTDGNFREVTLVTWP